MTSIAGSSASSMIRAVTSRPIRRIRSTMKPDSAITSSSLPSSEGWKRKNGSSIQRLEPRVAVARPNTSRIEPISSP